MFTLLLGEDTPDRISMLKVTDFAEKSLAKSFTRKFSQKQQEFLRGTFVLKGGCCLFTKMAQSGISFISRHSREGNQYRLTQSHGWKIHKQSLTFDISLNLGIKFHPHGKLGGGIVWSTRKSIVLMQLLAKANTRGVKPVCTNNPHLRQNHPFQCVSPQHGCYQKNLKGFGWMKAK